MHILYLHQYYNTPEMAGGPRAHGLATRFAAAGHQVTVLTTDRSPAPDAPRWRVASHEGVEVHWTPIRYSHGMSYRERLRAFLAFAWRGSRRARTIKPDVIFASSTPLTIAIPAVAAKRAHGTPLVLELRDLWPEAAVAIGAIRGGPSLWAAEALERFAYRHADRIIALAPRIAQGAILHGADPARLTLSTNAADPGSVSASDEAAARVRHGARIPPHAQIILYAGTLGMVNDCPWMARFARELVARVPTAWVVFLGDGKHREPIDAAAAGSDRIRCVGRVPRSDVGAWMKAASVGLCSCVEDPRLSADATNKVADYLGAGLPIAVNYGGSRTSRLSEAGAAIRLDRDPAIAARRMAARLADTSWLQSAGEASAALGRGEFGMEAIAGAVLETLLAASTERP